MVLYNITHLMLKGAIPYTVQYNMEYDCYGTGVGVGALVRVWA